MVSTQHIDLAWVSKFVCKQKGDDLNVVWISVYVVSLEEVFFVRGRSNLVEESKEVLQLPMRIACYDDWCLHFNYDWF